MCRYAKLLLISLFAFSLLFSACYAFKNPFKKKEPEPKPKMVETRQEWEIEAQNIPIEERDFEKQNVQQDEADKKKPKMPELRYTFERYNYPQGKRELNIEDIKKKLSLYPYVVADNQCRYIAYPYYYFSPDSNQISSNFYVEELDISKTKTKRILEYNHKRKQRTPIIEAGTKEIYPNLFNGLTLVDWSADSRKLLIKEKVGSTYGGVYKTYLYVHFMGNNIEAGQTVRLDDFDKAVKYYYIDWENKQINKYRYDIEPLGFSAENDNLIIALCYVYDKDNNKIFLGTWGYNIETNTTLLLSKTDVTHDVSINGLILKQTLE
ncbi:hypothetical protein IJX73_03440 [bacterium]|nr:hypothetical protein [bacterium]